MGRIKTAIIKRTAERLLEDEELKEKFTADFEKNKLILSNTMPSKSIRNKIAGYITRLKKRKENPIKQTA